jgi:hypothetical protein
MVYEINWSHFSQTDFGDLQRRISQEWQEILAGGEYYGQVRIQDVCYDIQAEWLRRYGRRKIYVTMTPFYPHRADSSTLPYEELVEGMPYDIEDGASIVLARQAVLLLDYAGFVCLAEQEIEQGLQLPVFQEALRHDTGFWERHDARLRQQARIRCQ